MDVAGESKDKEVKIDITEYLPDDVILPEEVKAHQLLSEPIYSLWEVRNSRYRQVTLW